MEVEEDRERVRKRGREGERRGRSCVSIENSMSLEPQHTHKATQANRHTQADRQTSMVRPHRRFSEHTLLMGESLSFLVQ